MKHFLAALFFVIALPTFGVEHSWGIRAGLTTENDVQAVAGAEYVLRFGSGWAFNPNAETSFGDNGTLTLNADLAYQRGLFWIGAGLAEVIPYGEDLDFGINVIGGFGPPRHRAPYVQVKSTWATNDRRTVLVAGFRF